MPLPNPPTWNWSTDFTAIDGEEFTDRAVTGSFVRMFVNAINERGGAINLSPFPLAYPAIGDDALASSQSYLIYSPNIGWGFWQLFVDSMCVYYMRQGFTVDGSSLVKNCRYSDANNTTIDANFPSPNGWTRKLPRVIYTLSQTTGQVNGNRAWFVQHVSETYYQTLSTDPLWKTTVTTPVLERSNSGKFFTFSAGAWSLSNDQTSPPDILSEFNVLTVPGDIFGGWICNDIRDAINQLTEIFESSGAFTISGGTYNGSIAEINSNVLSNQAFASTLSTGLTGSHGLGSGNTQAAAQAAYSAFPHTGGNVAYLEYTSASPGTASYTLEAEACVIVAPLSTTDINGGGQLFGETTVGASLSNFPNKNRTFQFYVFGVPAFGGTFDAQNDAIIQNGIWKAYGASIAPTTAGQITGPTLGSSTAPPNWLANGTKGWQCYRGVLLDWAVTGGFKYVSGYTGT